MMVAKREFLQLSHKYNPKKHKVIGWLASEKLDGIRAFWDGGITKGLYADEVPWANVEKDARLLNRPVATGLWSRYGKVIYAPHNWLNKLPRYILDGELYLGPQSWQQLSSIVKVHEPTDEWMGVKYMVFDSPSYYDVFSDGIINVTNYKKEFENILSWLANKGIDVCNQSIIPFGQLYKRLHDRYIENDIVKIHEQVVIKSIEHLNGYMDSILEKGGEGAILRNPLSYWKPERTHNCLKFKPFHDDEAIVIGYTWGRKTELGSKLLGKMGALICNYNSKRFELSGFTDSEREMIGPGGNEYIEKQGQEVSESYYNPNFPIESIITFRYRELSDDGIPKEARFLRNHIAL